MWWSQLIIKWIHFYNTRLYLLSIELVVTSYNIVFWIDWRWPMKSLWSVLNLYFYQSSCKDEGRKNIIGKLVVWRLGMPKVVTRSRSLSKEGKEDCLLLLSKIVSDKLRWLGVIHQKIFVEIHMSSRLNRLTGEES